MLNIAVFVSGGGTNLQSLIDATKSGKLNAKINLVFSNSKKAYALKRAEQNGIETLCFTKKEIPNDEEFDLKLISELKSRNIDLIVLAGYLKILTINLVKDFNNKIINIHPSLIPSFCGKNFYGENVHKEVIKKGVKITGATTHFVNEKVDDGYILMQECVLVDDTDDYKSIAKKVLEVEHKLLVDTVIAFCNNRIVIKDNRAIILEDSYEKSTN